ncbi:MAG: hypothetical protein Q4A66_06570 [Eubacteriales bacterium]|nr:hypothetical protein [Eubacteriales bacterium]
MLDILRPALGWVFVLSSLTGWAGAFAHYGKLRAELSVPLSACAVVLLVYISGLCGSLAAGAWLAACAGAALLVLVTLRHRDVWRSFATPGFAFLVLFGAFVAAQVYDDPLAHNDDFNHWAVMVRNMLLLDRFPDASVTAIDFSSYPPGTAVFNYFVNRMCFGAYSEGRLIFSQNLMVLMFLPPLFLPMHGRSDEGKADRAALYGMLCACAVLIFLYEFRALVVDVVNGAIGFAALAGVLALRDEPKKAAFYAGLVTCVGLLVKYSNIFYFAVTAVALLWVCRCARRRGEKSGLGAALLAGGLCAALVLTWFVHVRVAFGGVADMHSMNLGRILDVLRGWSQEDVRAIARVCLHMATSPTKSAVLLTLFMNAVALALAAWHRIAFRRSPARLLRAVALADAAYIAYQLMLFAAYLLSFPRDEALRAASYGRYNMSIMIWVIGFLSYVCVEEMRALGGAKGARAWRALCGTGFALVTCAALVITGEGATLVQAYPYEGTRQHAADIILSQNEFDDSDSFFVLAADPDARQVASVFHYKVNRHVDSVASAQELLALCSEHDYLIIMENDARIAALLEGLDLADGLIGAYPMEEVAALAP